MRAPLWSLLGLSLLILLVVNPAAARPAAAPSGAFLLCYQYASGGADHSEDPDPAEYPMRALAQWTDGTGTAIGCRVIYAGG